MDTEMPTVSLPRLGTEKGEEDSMHVKDDRGFALRSANGGKDDKPAASLIGLCPCHATFLSGVSLARYAE